MDTTIHEKAPAYFPSASDQAKQATENLRADIMRLVLDHRNHDGRAVGRFSAAVEQALQRYQPKLDQLGKLGARVGTLKSELTGIANRAIEKPKADGNVFAFEAAA
jgi:hypothetical protein